MDLGSKFLRQDSEMTLPKGSVSDLPFSLKQWDCALSVTDPSQKAISEPFVRQVHIPIFAVIILLPVVWDKNGPARQGHA